MANMSVVEFRRLYESDDLSRPKAPYSGMMLVSGKHFKKAGLAAWLQFHAASINKSYQSVAGNNGGRVEYKCSDERCPHTVVVQKNDSNEW